MNIWNIPRDEEIKIAKPTDWNTKPMPEKNACISLNREFSEDQMAKIKVGVVPEEMEDKWFVFFKDDVLYFHRSWTGYCIYMLQFKQIDNEWLATEFIVNQDAHQYMETDNNDRRKLSYLIDMLLLKQTSDFLIEDVDSDTT